LGLAYSQVDQWNTKKSSGINPPSMDN
jgi:hypothetical protein